MSKSTTKNPETSVTTYPDIHPAAEAEEGKGGMQRAEWFGSEASNNKDHQGLQRRGLVAVWLRR
ncbi:MAG: hypothetical protein H8E21_15245 [Gammaproteobacteria bacterium]|nr:hypothetical protein [Gammaproteobacteria bacterium]MBL7000018.1 hypothetical protein [Gammaproteobacteria bacterium]